MQRLLLFDARLEKLRQGEGRSGQVRELDGLVENALGFALAAVDEG